MGGENADFSGGMFGAKRCGVVNEGLRWPAMVGENADLVVAWPVPSNVG